MWWGGVQGRGKLCTLWWPRSRETEDGTWVPLSLPFKIIPQWCTLPSGLIFSSSHHLIARQLETISTGACEGSLTIPKNTTPSETEQGANFLTQFGCLGSCLSVIFWLLIHVLALTFCTKSCVLWPRLAPVLALQICLQWLWEVLPVFRNRVSRTRESMERREGLWEGRWEEHTGSEETWLSKSEEMLVYLRMSSTVQVSSPRDPRAWWHVDVVCLKPEHWAVWEESKAPIPFLVFQIKHTWPKHLGISNALKSKLFRWWHMP